MSPHGIPVFELETATFWRVAASSALLATDSMTKEKEGSKEHMGRDNLPKLSAVYLGT